MRTKKECLEFRKLRVRRRIVGMTARPRLTVFRSLKHVYAQVIDDNTGRTVVSASSREKGFARSAGVKMATTVGTQVAERALAKGVKEVVFDRGGRPYHGQVKALAEAARSAGLKI